MMCSGNSILPDAHHPLKDLVKTRASIIAGGILAIIGGILILQSGVSTRSFLLTVASYSFKHFGAGLPGIAQDSVDLALLVLGALIALGGLLAILGGFLVLMKHRLSGKILIALGGGMGFIGIAISMGYDIYTTGISSLFTHVQYWIGIVIASIGRYLA
jgi:hypothetical protein